MSPLLSCTMPMTAVSGEPHGLRLDLGPVALDDAGRLELADAFVHGRRGQADLPGQLRIWKAGVVSKQVDELSIDRIHRVQPNGRRFSTANYPTRAISSFPGHGTLAVL